VKAVITMSLIQSVEEPFLYHTFHCNFHAGNGDLQPTFIHQVLVEQAEKGQWVSLVLIYSACLWQVNPVLSELSAQQVKLPGPIQRNQMTTLRGFWWLVTGNSRRKSKAVSASELMLCPAGVVFG